MTLIGDPGSATPGAAYAMLDRLERDDPECGERIGAARLTVAWPRSEAWFGESEASHLNGESYVIDAGIGSLTEAGLEATRSRGARLIRVNIWPALSGVLEQAHESARVVEEALGWGELGGTPIVAGGAVGRAGDVIVDNVRKPTRVIGLADGRGGVAFNYDEHGAARVRRVKEEINRRLLSPSE